MSEELEQYLAYLGPAVDQWLTDNMGLKSIAIKSTAAKLLKQALDEEKLSGAELARLLKADAEFFRDQLVNAVRAVASKGPGERESLLARCRMYASKGPAEAQQMQPLLEELEGDYYDVAPTVVDQLGDLTIGGHYRAGPTGKASRAPVFSAKFPRPIDDDFRTNLFDQRVAEVVKRIGIQTPTDNLSALHSGGGSHPLDDDDATAAEIESARKELEAAKWQLQNLGLTSQHFDF